MFLKVYFITILLTIAYRDSFFQHLITLFNLFLPLIIEQGLEYLVGLAGSIMVA